MSMELDAELYNHWHATSNQTPVGRLLTGVESELEMLRNLQGVSSRMK